MTAPPLTFMEQIKDKASSVLPSPFSEEVERTTSGVSAAPDFEGAMFLCDFANSEEHVADIVRAVRRRFKVDNGKIRYFTIVLLDMLVKNGYGILHQEIAENKGLIHDLLGVALMPFPTEAYGEAKKAALTFILSASKWFAAHPNPKCKIFTELPDVVRRCASDPTVFDDVTMDTSVRIHTEFLPPTSRRGAPSRPERPLPARMGPRAAISLPPPSPRVVRAIPIEVPTDEAASGMLDACMVLSECLADVTASGGVLAGNDLTSTLAAQIRRDHTALARLVVCGLPLPHAEVLHAVVDGQAAVLEQFDHAIRRETVGLEGERSVDARGGVATNAKAAEGGGASLVAAPSTPPPPTQAPMPVLSSAQFAPLPSTGERRKPQSRYNDAHDEVEMASLPVPRQVVDVDAPKAQPSKMDTPKVEDPFEGLFGPAQPPAAPPTAPPTASVPSGGSLNGDGDDFDEFLNRRLAGGN